jgi:GNAT superfamily N-acetyltransferase
VDELAAALAFDRGLRARAARETIELPEGLVVLHEELPRLRYLNALILDAPLPASFGAGSLAGLADVRLGHLRHRHVVVDDGPAAERLAPALLRDGWSMERTLYMSWRREPDRPPRPGVGREISEPKIRKLQAEIYGEDSESASPVAAALIATLVAGQDAVRASTTALCFGAGEGDAMSASCTLFLERADGHGGIAMVDEVGTLIAHRRRGLGRAVVAAALEAARRMRCAPILVPADADDWPRKLYQRMGFEPLGMQVSFTLTPAR